MLRITYQARRQSAFVQLRRLAFGLASTLAAAACGDPLALKADLAVTADTLVSFAMTGVPLGFPAALNTSTRSLARIDPSFSFDVAFDIDAGGQALIVPVRLVGGTATVTRQVGLQKISKPFAEATQAPSSGYVADSVLVLKTGESFFVQALSSQCSLFVNQYLYSKVAIDSVVAAKRTIFFQLVHNPNCGFRSLVPGVVPKN